jgi:hypothetical protein
MTILGTLRAEVQEPRHISGSSEREPVLQAIGGSTDREHLRMVEQTI